MKFKISIVSRELLTPLFYKDHLAYIAYSSFFKFWSTLLPLHTYTPAHLNIPVLFLSPCFFDWMGDRATSDVLFYLIKLWI